MVQNFSLSENKKYWEDKKTISIIDVNLHRLEMDLVLKHLSENMIIADIGSGNGEATLEYAKCVNQCFGIERSENMRRLANENLDVRSVNNIEFCEGDVLTLTDDNKYDAVITQRVLINLPSWENQKQAIDNIFKSLKKGGLYIMIENTWDGQNQMNEYRQKVNLKPIELHWHNQYLDYDLLIDSMKDKFELIERQGFNLYYFLTRVFTQTFADFTGCGINASADPIFKEADKAARKMQELFGDSITFTDAPILGPIQGIVFRKL